MNLIESYYHWKTELIGYARGEKNITPSKIYILRILRKMAWKLKNILFLHLMTTVSFALKIKISWDKRVVKLILETRKINYVTMYVSFICSQIKNLDNIHCKK